MLVMVFMPAIALAGDWNSLGPGNSKIYSLAVSPDGASVFAASNGEGVFRSTDGETWTAANEGLSNLSVYTVAVSPRFASDSTVFAGTNGDGIFKSTDGGDTWDPVNKGLSYRYISSIAIAPTSEETPTIFTGTNGGGVYKSTVTDDGTMGWARITAGLPTSVIVRSIAFSPDYAADSTVFVAVADTSNTLGEVYRSANGGDSWERDNSDLGFVSAVAVSPNFSTDHTVFASTIRGIYKSVDGGVNWTSCNTGFATSFAMSSHYGSDSTIYAGTNGGAYKSTNGGLNWASASAGLNWIDPKTGNTKSTVLTLAISPAGNAVYAGTFGGGVFTTASPTIDRTDKKWELPAGGDSGGQPGDNGSGGGGGGGGGDSQPPQDIIVPNAPTGLKAAAIKTEIDLTWNANADQDLAGYNVYRSEGSLDPVKINGSLVITPSFSDTQVLGKTVYKYYVTAIDKAGNESNKSAVAEAALTDVLGAVTFSDTPASAWYKPFISKLVTGKIISGFPDGTFRPNESITRAEFAKMICLAMKWNVVTPAKSSFTDVAANHWARGYIETAKAHGAITGYPDGTFGPSSRITRAEIATIIAKTLRLGAGSTSLWDVKGSWAKNYIGSCVKAGIISGYTDGTFKPAGRATRAEGAKMVAGTVKD
jgi:hypothetical protein